MSSSNSTYANPLENLPLFRAFLVHFSRQIVVLLRVFPRQGESRPSKGEMQDESQVYIAFSLIHLTKKIFNMYLLSFCICKSVYIICNKQIDFYHTPIHTKSMAVRKPQIHPWSCTTTQVTLSWQQLEVLRLISILYHPHWMLGLHVGVQHFVGEFAVYKMEKLVEIFWILVIFKFLKGMKIHLEHVFW